MPCIHDLQTARQRWKRSSNPDAFGTFAADPSHWYTFHHGGRTEAQFNLGMFPTHFRVGMGFEFSLKKGGDPTIVGLVYSQFCQVIRANEQHFRDFIKTKRLEVEWSSNTLQKFQFIKTDQAYDWLLKLPIEPQWVFIGRLLKRDDDQNILSNASLFGETIAEVFTKFRPLWEETQMLASAIGK